MLSAFRGAVVSTEARPTPEGMKYVATLKVRSRQIDYVSKIDLKPGQAGLFVLGDEEIIWLEQ